MIHNNKPLLEVSYLFRLRACFGYALFAPWDEILDYDHSSSGMHSWQQRGDSPFADQGEKSDDEVIKFHGSDTEPSETETLLPPNEPLASPATSKINDDGSSDVGPTTWARWISKQQTVTGRTAANHETQDKQERNQKKKEKIGRWGKQRDAGKDDGDKGQWLTKSKLLRADEGWWDVHHIMLHRFASIVFVLWTQGRRIPCSVFAATDAWWQLNITSQTICGTSQLQFCKQPEHCMWTLFCFKRHIDHINYI